MTKVAILDDEIIICETLSKHLQELGYEVAGYALNYKEAVDLLEQTKPDVFLADINLNHTLTGRDFGAHLRKTVSLPLIFITSYSDKATLDSIKHLNPDGYLVKPFNKNDLFTAIEVALNNFNNRAVSQNKNEKQADGFFIKQDSFFVKVKYEDLIYIKSEGVYVELFTENKKYLHRETLKNLLDLFLPENFIQTHRSYIVNLKHVSAASKESVKIKEISVPVSPSFANDLFSKLNIA